MCVIGFLLLLFITGAHPSPDADLLFGVVGGHVDFDPGNDRLDDNLELIRVSAGEDLLLVDCSQPERPQPDGYDVKCVTGNPNPHDIRHNAREIDYSDRVPSVQNYLTMNNLSMSQSGEYRLEARWTQAILNSSVAWMGRIRYRRRKIIAKQSKSFHLTVCAEGDKELSVEIALGGRVILCGMNCTLGNTSLQLYQSQFYRSQLNLSQPNAMLVLDTDSSLEPLAEDLRGRLQVDLNTLQVTLSGVMDVDDYSRFYCVTWRKDQCENVNYLHLDLGYNATYVFAHEEENVTLSCVSFQCHRDKHVRWSTHTEYGRLTIDQAHQQEVMYMLNSSQTWDCSLIIPNVSLKHSGQYECSDFGDVGNFSKRHILENIRLFVCSITSPLDVMFSDGESLCLEEITPNFMRSVHGAQWYRQKFLEPKALFLDTKQGLSPLLKDLKGRMNVTAGCFPIISNLTAEDSGLYTWRVYGLSMKLTWVCSEGSFRLVYRDPFGVDSPFYRVYAPVIGCGLLGLVTAVIWFKLRSRRGEQTSGRQSREGQQSGDKDLQEEVEMAEIRG